MSITALIKLEETLLTRLASGCCRCVTVCASRAAVWVISSCYIFSYSVLVRGFIYNIL